LPPVNRFRIASGESETQGAPAGITADGKAIAAVFSAMQTLAVSYVDNPTANNTVFQQPNPFNYREDNVRLDYRFNEKHNMYGRYFMITTI